MRYAWVVLLLASLTSSAWGAAVTGTATYRERIAMPRGARFEAILEDVSRADARAVVVARTRISSPGNPPIHFRIQFPASRILRRHTYSVRAQILVDGRPWFAGAESYPVLTRGRGNEVSILMRRVGVVHKPGGPRPQPAYPTHAALEGTDWRLTRIGARLVSVSARQRFPYIALEANGHRVVGSGGCNRLSGDYRLSGDRLQFGAIAITRMACIDGMDTENAFLRALDQVRSWRVVGNGLNLFDIGRNQVLRFEARESR